MLFVCIVMLFIFSVGFYSLFTTKFDFSNEENTEQEPRHLALFKSDFGPLCGMMCLGYYLHNCVIPILRNSRNPEYNKRDMFLGYFLVFLSYTLVGIAGYIGFSGKNFSPPIQQNSLQMFGSRDILPTVI